MKLIVGLGNPGEKYKNNRHNVGFQFVDFIIENLKKPNSNFQIPNKFQISNFKFQKNLSSTIYHLPSKIILAKLLTFMNNSGQAVKKILTDYRIPITDLLVVHDDLDIPLGKFKIQKGIGPKLHNGIESIEKTLNTKDFWRLRIGVDNRMNTGWTDGETYVLQDLTAEEKKIMEEIVFKAIMTRLTLFQNNPEKIRSRKNQKPELFS